MIAALQERGWEGDDVLADQFDALLEAPRCRICALYEWIWMSWPASSKAIPCTAADAST